MKKIAVVGLPYRQTCELLGDPLGNKSKTGSAVLKIMCNFICKIFTAGIHRGAEILFGMLENLTVILSLSVPACPTYTK